jgi:hypothetical protein
MVAVFWESVFVRHVEVSGFLIITKRTSIQ